MKKEYIILLILLFPFILESQNSNLKIKVYGTGNTTGHIANMKIVNNTKNPVPFTMDNYYIPSDGKHQGYIIPMNEDPDLMINPGETTIPLNGFCTDIRKPPVGDGDDFLPFTEWIPQKQLKPAPKPGDFIDESVFKPKEEVPAPDALNPAEANAIELTYPGTKTKFPYKIDIDKHPKDAAPLLFEAINRITEAFDSLILIDEINTPFSNNPKKEKESVIQQSFWIYTSVLTGDPYEKRDFELKMKEQFKNATGNDIERADTVVKNQFNDGINRFWDTFELVGSNAKVIREYPEPSQETPFLINNEEQTCEYKIGETPGFRFKMIIDDSWKDEEERKKIIAQAMQQISTKGSWKPDTNYYIMEGGLKLNPTCAIGFFKNNIIGAFCSGYAKTYLRDQKGKTEYVSATERITLDTNGSATISMMIIPPEKWSSFVVGSSFTKLRASSSSFDAVAGNSKYGLDFLRITKFAAKTSLKYLFNCATGRTVKSFYDYAKDATTDELKSLSEEKAKEKLKELNKEFNDLLDELDISLDDIKKLTKKDIKNLLKEKLGIKSSSLDELIDEGLDAGINMFFVSNTYAAANGGLVVKIGDQKESAVVYSRALYLRKELEDSKKAVTGTGPMVKSFYVSDVKPDSISINTIGNILMMTQAKGNGNADAYLESMQLQVLVGVCKDSESRKYKWNTEIIVGAYFHDEENAPNMGEDLLNKLIKDLNEKIIEELNYDSTEEDWKNVVDEFIRDKSKEYPFNK